MTRQDKARQNKKSDKSDKTDKTEKTGTRRQHD